ncbi:MAG: hypothetical protein ACE5GL_02170 [Calditrichia bacterium]
MNSFKRNFKITRIDWFLIALLAVHFLFIHSWQPGYVLCLGGDGHVAIESANTQFGENDAEFYNFSEAAVWSLPSDETTVPHAGSCIDLSLHPDGDEKAPNIQRNPDIDLLIPQANSLQPRQLIADGNARELFLLKYVYLHTTSLISLKTTVLLI